MRTSPFGSATLRLCVSDIHTNLVRRVRLASVSPPRWFAEDVFPVTDSILWEDSQRGFIAWVAVCRRANLPCRITEEHKEYEGGLHRGLNISGVLEMCECGLCYEQDGG